MPKRKKLSMYFFHFHNRTEKLFRMFNFKQKFSDVCFFKCTIEDFIKNKIRKKNKNTIVDSAVSFSIHSF